MTFATDAKRSDIFEGFKEFDNHQSVTFLYDEKTGLRGFIAIHNTNLGPAVGGTRFWHYESEEQALRDALRLSRAMTYKCALAGVSYGGGKAVLMAPEKNAAIKPEYLAAYADRLMGFDCPFYTGEDVGISEDDVALLAKHAPTCIIGKPGVGGMPAHWAALSVYRSMQAAAESCFGSPSLKGKRIAVKGLGNVGGELCEFLTEEGAAVVAADIDEKKIESVRSKIPSITIVPTDAILGSDVDIYAPCAMGDEFNERTVPLVKAKIVCGAANNQLTTTEMGEKLHERGILYVPDYVANAGGLINVVDELSPTGYSRERVAEKTDGVGETVKSIIEHSRALGLSTSKIADSIAESRFLKK